MLLIKLTLVPLLIAGVTLATRRWGPRAGGLLMALPVVAGPTLAIYAVEQGKRFAAEAAAATLLGLVAVAAFCLTYAHAAPRWRWPVSVTLGWLAFGVTTALLYRVSVGPVASVVFALAALLGTRSLIPQEPPTATPITRPRWDIPIRMAVAALLVVVLTSIATWLGPSLSGILTPFPTATAIIAGFTHAHAGPTAARRFLREFIPGLCTFAVFCVVLSPALRTFAAPVAFAVALLVQLTLQAVIVWQTSGAAPTGDIGGVTSTRGVRPERPDSH